MTTEDLFQNDPARQNLLQLVSRGHAVIAEMNRLSDHIPPVFRMETKEDQQKYGEIILDYKYISHSDYWDQKLDSNVELLDLMEEFRVTHLDILKRFYLMFESVYRYATDLVSFCQQIKEGIYVSHTIETILNDIDTRQLLMEAVQLYGVMLLNMDQKLEGPVRERILVAFYRSKGPVESANVENVIQLCRSTGWNNQLGWNKKPSNYPESFFNRIPLPKDILSLMLNRLRSDDLYMQLKYYPSPEQRSVALASMAGITFIILFFMPEVLNKQPALMNELVNRFFHDNWVISYYMGNRVDLTAAWDGYKAARQALQNVLTEQVVKNTIMSKQEFLVQLTEDVNKYLGEGVLIEDYVIDHIPQLMSCLRNANCTLRWIMLHLTTTNRKFSELVNKTFNQKQVLSFLLIVAQLELTMKNIFTQLINTKQARWDKLKGACTEIIAELANFFSGATPMSKITKNADLEKWFRDILVEITNLNYSEPTSAGRKAAKMITALEEVEQYQQIESSLQIRQFLGDVRQNLTLMIRTINTREEILVNINIVSDMSYAWETAASYIQLMQETVRQQANIVSKLRATFLKLSTMLEFPIMRIIQGKSPDQESVAEYYSTKLVAFVRSVLEVVPVSLFNLMSSIIQLQTTKMREIPPKFAKDQLKDLAQMDLRLELAKLTHSVVSFTDGILEMETTTMGIIEIDPKRLLEDGVRKELVQKLAIIFHRTLYFPQSGRIADFEDRLYKLYYQTTGLKSSFEYIQDYIGMYGLKIWQEEIQRMANFFVEQECNSFLKKKVFEWQSDYQSEAAPIPLITSNPSPTGQPLSDTRSITFLGRVARELIELTSPFRCVYSTARCAWLDQASRAEIAGNRLFALLYSALDVSLFTGIDKLFSFMITSNLSNMIRVYRREVTKPIQQRLHTLAQSLAPGGSVPQTNIVLQARDATEKLIPQMMTVLTECILRIGHLQLLRSHIQSRLSAAIRLESGVLSGTLSNLNRAILLDVEQHYLHPDTAPYPSSDSPLLPELSKYLEAAGLGDPFNRIYVATDPLPYLDFLLFVATCGALSRMAPDPRMPGALLGRSPKDGLDAVLIATGLATLLKQFHSSYTSSFLERYGQFAKAIYTDYGKVIPKEDEINQKTKILLPPPELQNLVHFLPIFKSKCTLPDEMFDAVFPKNFFESF